MSRLVQRHAFPVALKSVGDEVSDNEVEGAAGEEFVGNPDAKGSSNEEELHVRRNAAEGGGDGGSKSDGVEDGAGAAGGGVGWRKEFALVDLVELQLDVAIERSTSSDSICVAEPGELSLGKRNGFLLESALLDSGLRVQRPPENVVKVLKRAGGGAGACVAVTMRGRITGAELSLRSTKPQRAHCTHHLL